MWFKSIGRFVHMHVVPQRPEEGTRSFSVRVTGARWLPDMGAGNQMQAFNKSNMCS